MEWERHRELFEWDGSLIDIYVLDTTMADWQRMLDCVRSSAYELRYRVEGAADLPLPQRVEAIFAQRSDAGTLLTIDAPQLCVNCHFFTVEEIDFDIDPRAIDGQPRLDRLVDFIGMLRDALNKEVLLTPENLPSRPLWRFNA
jgi:hypothetical protein